PADDWKLGDALSTQLDHRGVERLIRMRQFEILADDLAEPGSPSINSQRPLQIVEGEKTHQSPRPVNHRIGMAPFRERLHVPESLIYAYAVIDGYDLLGVLLPIPLVSILCSLTPP